MERRDVRGGRVTAEHMQIGEVAERVGLSLRTIRYYEEMGLAPPSARSPGGFRLYTESDVARLQLIKRMKPLDFSVEEIRTVLSTMDALAGDTASGTERAELLDRLTLYHQLARQRVETLQAQTEAAQGFASDLEAEIARRRAVTESGR